MLTNANPNEPWANIFLEVTYEYINDRIDKFLNQSAGLQIWPIVMRLLLC